MTTTKRHSNFTDLTGQKYGSLIVLNLHSFVQKKNGKESVWKCICECGKETIVHRSNLKTAKGCGCKRGAKSKSYNEHIINNIINSYKQKCKSRQLVFELTKNEFVSLILQPCFYCGSPGMTEKQYKTKRGQTTGNVKCNGIDRVDNNLGYILSNCVSCCKICNRAKSSLEYHKFQEWISDLVNFHKEQN